MTEKIFFASGESPKMIAAIENAQKTFKYFWRELSWEYRRIVPALDMACVKVAFAQQAENANTPNIEHLWINEIDYDGEKITGILVNDPELLTNVKNGDVVAVPLNQISDWLFCSREKTYGGFTIQAMRAEMGDKERAEHDEAWGLDFGDYNDILLVYEQKEKPENLVEHPMSKNMKDSLSDFIKQNPGELTSKDDNGNTFLHREAIAGNLTSVTVLKQAGASSKEKNNLGKTPLDYAKQLGWEAVIAELEN